MNPVDRATVHENFITLPLSIIVFHLEILGSIQTLFDITIRSLDHVDRILIGLVSIKDIVDLFVQRDTNVLIDNWVTLQDGV